MEAQPHGPPRHVHTQWYIADTSGPTILDFSSTLKLGVMQLNYTIQFACKFYTPDLSRGPTTEHGEVRGDLLHLWKLAAQHRQTLLPPLNSSKDLIAIYPDCFEGIGHFLRMYTIHLGNDAKPVIHAPHKCPITMHSLVCEKLDEFLQQEIIAPFTEPTDWVSSLAYSWKANG